MNEGMDKEIREALHAKIVFPKKYKAIRTWAHFTDAKIAYGEELLNIVQRMKYYRTPNAVFVVLNENILKNITPGETYAIPRNNSEWEELFIALLYKEFVINKFGDLCE